MDYNHHFLKEIGLTRIMCLKIKDLYLSAVAKPENNGSGKTRVENSNTDVIVLIEEDDDFNGKREARYVASFFTYKNIFKMKSRHYKSGEYLNGKYFYSKNMLLIDDCSIENIRIVVDHLIDEGGFREVFRKI